MGRPREFDEKDALRKAVRTFWKNGFFDTSIGMLEREMGINRFSIYATFKSKDELFARALREYRLEVLGGVLAFLETEDADTESINKFFKNLLSKYDPAGENYGCLMVNTAAELAAHDHPAWPEFSDYKKYITDLFRKALVRGKRLGQISSEDSPDSLAAYFFGLALGIGVYVKCNPGTEALSSFVDHGLSVLKVNPSRNRRPHSDTAR